MLNIKNIGEIESIDSLTNGRALPEGAHKFKESDNLSDIFYDGLIIGSPILILVIALTFYRYETVPERLTFNWVTWLVLALTLVITYFMSYVHELIHALAYPKGETKLICQIKSQGAHLLYCDATISKTRFILVCLAPTIALAGVPFLIWYIFAPTIAMPYNSAVMIFYMLMFISAIGDYANVFNALRQVPRGAKVFNYGLHSYWIEK
ncbi:MAG: DUF3267 domain-containing protein [Clostridia bacterium]|nr:DUF3267 domain-containing protein [Clostridia bacterium]